MEITLEIIESVIGNTCTIAGKKEGVFTGMQTVNEAEKTDIAWIKPGVRDIKMIVNATAAGCIICDKETFDLFDTDKRERLFILSDDPKFTFVSFVKYINSKISVRKLPLIHPTAIIDPNCVLGENVQIGAYSVIGACKIGDNTIIGDYVKIHDPVTVGKNCLIREFCSIGGAGFGYLKNAQQQNEHIPHIGSVHIEDNVEIFPYANVDRGTLGKTRIKKGTVIDHYSHIGHNTTTGMNTIIAAGTVMAGGSMVGDNCFIGVHTVLKEKCVIGSNVLTGMGSVVVKNVPNNEIWVGNPARFLKENQ